MGSVMLPPKTMIELFRSLPEGTRVQLIENEIIMSPAPNDNHQKLLLHIAAAMLQWVETHKLGEVRIAPYDVFLDAENAFQPDIVFVSNENASLIKQDGLHGAPDLVIEILSPGTEGYDRKLKRDVYERSGVKEYWIIDPATKSAEGFSLTNGIYQPMQKTKGKLPSVLLNAMFQF